MSQFLPFTKELAIEAGRLVKKHFGPNIKVEWKSENDPVTKIDKASEDLIVKKITKNFPNHEILAEEGSINSSTKTSKYKWIIDPIDGTKNFARGIPHFAISIALEANNEIKIGVCYNPITDELFYAEKGKGAFLNKKRIHVSKTKELDKAMLATGFGSNRHSELMEKNLEYFYVLTKKASAIRRMGSAALDLCYVASGRLDAYWELKLNLWDIAAGALICEEAGGKVTDISGNNIKNLKPSILAANKFLHKDLLHYMV